jgi:hypothetical protein
MKRIHFPWPRCAKGLMRCVPAASPRGQQRLPVCEARREVSPHRRLGGGGRQPVRSRSSARGTSSCRRVFTNSSRTLIGRALRYRPTMHRCGRWDGKVLAFLYALRGHGQFIVARNNLVPRAQPAIGAVCKCHPKQVGLSVFRITAASVRHADESQRFGLAGCGCDKTR